MASAEPTPKRSITVFTVTHHGQRKFVGQMRHIEPTRFFGLYPLVDALNDKHRSNVRLMAPDLVDHAFAEEDHSRFHVFPFVVYGSHPVNAVVAYEKVGVPLGRELVFREGELSAVFPVPSDLVGERDIGLVAPSLTTRDFAKLGDETILTVPRERIIVVRSFPIEDGWYRQRDPRTAIPIGERVRGVPEDARSCCGIRVDEQVPGEQPEPHDHQEHIFDIPGARALRRHEGPYVGGMLRLSGAVAHNYDDFVSVTGALSETFTAFPFEIPEGDIGKLDIDYVRLTIKLGITFQELSELLASAFRVWYAFCKVNQNAHKHEKDVLWQALNLDIYHEPKGWGHPDLSSLQSFEGRELEPSCANNLAEILADHGNIVSVRADMEAAEQALGDLLGQLDSRVGAEDFASLRRYIALLKTARIEPIL